MVVSAPVLALPFVGSFPDQPPDAVQLVALLEDQLSVAEPPLLMLAGLALRLTAGAGVETLIVTDWPVLPPEPAQVSV